MANGMTWVIKHGEKGTVHTGTLLANGAAIDLTGKTVTMNARKTVTGAKVLSDIVITPDADQSANKGKIAWTVLEAHTLPANIEANAEGYLIEFKMVDGSVVDYVPKKKSKPESYGRLIIHENLD